MLYMVLVHIFSCYFGSVITTPTVWFSWSLFVIDVFPYYNQILFNISPLYSLRFTSQTFFFLLYIIISQTTSFHFHNSIYSFISVGPSILLNPVKDLELKVLGQGCSEAPFSCLYDYPSEEGGEVPYDRYNLLIDNVLLTTPF